MSKDMDVKGYIDKNGKVFVSVDDMLILMSKVNESLSEGNVKETNNYWRDWLLNFKLNAS